MSSKFTNDHLGIFDISLDGLKKNNRQNSQVYGIFLYYQSTILSYLKNCHPDKMEDIEMIRSRAESATNEFISSMDVDNNMISAMEMANQCLYSGLHFSIHDSIVSVLRNHFEENVPEEELTQKALELQPFLAKECSFENYDFSYDDFGYLPEHQTLQTEMIGALQIKLEEDGCL